MNIDSNPAIETPEELVARFLGENRSFLAPDKEIMTNHHVHPRTEREERVLEKSWDTHLLSDIRTSLQAALDETYGIAEMTVASPAASCGDMSTAYFTAAGDLAMTSTRGIAGFSVCLHYTIRFINKYFKEDPTVGVEPGDCFVVNDCHYGGIHSPDQHMFMPIFDEADLVGWACCAMHEGEVGAKVPGGMGPTIESPWDEGLRGSPIKVVENYQVKRDLVTLLQNNSREPQIILADIKARLSACCRLERRFVEQLREHDGDTLVAFLRSDVEFIRDEARRRIIDLPDGTMRQTFYVDHTMREPGLVRLNFNYTVKGDKIILDMSGSAPELYNRPINSLLCTQSIGVAVGLAYYIWPDLPCCQAILDNFEFVAPENSISNASADVPVALCIQPMFKAITSAELAFSKFYYGASKRYGKTKAAWFNQPQSIIYGGVNQHLETVGNMCGDINGMAGGAKFDSDGEHSISPCFGSATDLGEAEDSEANLPFIYAIGKKLWPDNCGFGKYRSGNAYQFGLMRFGDQPFGFQGFTSGSYFPSTLGLFGGYACPTYAVCRIRGKNLFAEFKENPELFNADMFSLMNDQPIAGATYESLSSAVPFEFYPEGELYMQSQGAGGGYGDVLERDPNLVIKDLEENLISHETARDVYHVSYNPKNLVVDMAETERLRSEEKLRRIERGLTWDEFLAEHVDSHPPTFIPYYGSWNCEEELHAGPYGCALAAELPPIMLADPLEVENAALKSELAELQRRLAECEQGVNRGD
ncbi:MAG: hydantoinase B/oxoprolinase family protein [Pseudomonadota bacterium]